MYSLILLASSTLAAGAADAPTPTVCLKTTITERGRARDTVIVEGTGRLRHDRGAKRFIEVLDFARMPLGVTLDQTGHAIVEVLGPDTWNLAVTGGTLHESCAAARAALSVPASD